jgi:hypothetical protein
MAEITINDLLNAINTNNATAPTPTAPRGSSNVVPQDIKDDATRTAFIDASAAASELLGAIKRYQTGATSGAELNKIFTAYKKKRDLLKKQNSSYAANVEVAAFGKPITPGLASPTIQSNGKGKTKKAENSNTGALPQTDEQLVQNEFAKAGVSADGTVQYGFPNPNGEGTSAGAAYVYVEPAIKGGTAYNGSGLYSNPDQDKSFQFGSTDEVLNKYYAQLVKQYGSKTALAQKLQEAGKLSNAKTADRSKILSALNGVVATYTQITLLL